MHAILKYKHRIIFLVKIAGEQELIRRLKKVIDSCWARHKAFRVGFVAAFLLSLIAISVYAFY